MKTVAWDPDLGEIIERDMTEDELASLAQIQSVLNAPADTKYRIGKSTPWRRMTDEEAVIVSNAMKQQTIKNQMIYDAASYIDTSDELFGTLKGLLTQLFAAKRADELLAPEEP
jgi:hypothetical protein